MASIQRPGRGKAQFVSFLAAAAAAVLVALTLASPSAPAHAAVRSTVANSGPASGFGHRPWPEPWFATWLASLGHHGGLAGHARAVNTAVLSAPHPPGTTVSVGANPTAVVADPATHTVYVADNSVSVINTASCNAANTSGCGHAPAVTAIGSYPLGLALNHKTHTLYAAIAWNGTVLVVNAALCNAQETSGCGQAPASVTVGSFPDGLAVDQATDTIYVANGNDNTVSVINGATCNATDTSGCGHTTATITVGSGPGALEVDHHTGTLYVANYNDGTVSVIDAATCNSEVTSGCGQTPVTVPVGPKPVGVAIDDPTHTVYVPVSGAALGSMSMINATRCNATHTSGCGATPASTPIGSGPMWVTFNPLTHTVYAASQEDSNLAAINASTCNATTTVGCRQQPPAISSGFDVGGADVDTATDTLYVSSQNNDTVSVLNGGTCNATTTSGCTKYASVAAAGVGPQPVAVNQKTHTIYVANSTDNTVSVISASACNPDHVSGCAGTWPTISVGTLPLFGIAVDEATDTIYVSNLNSGTVSVINGATCNAHVTSGCGQAAPTITVGECPAGLAINHVTGTLYVADACHNSVSAINMAICNAKNTSGCGQTAAKVATGNGPIPVGVNQATDTIYVGNNGDSTVSVINGASCNAHVVSGCGQVAPAVAVADSPYGLAVDQHSDTVYVPNTGNEFFNNPPTSVNSSVSVINGATCNGQITSGCGQTPFAIPVGGFDWDVAINPGTGLLYVTSIVDSDVAVISTATCNGHDTSGCQPRLLHLRTGGWPADIAVDPADGAMYITDNVDGAMSVYPLS